MSLIVSKTLDCGATLLVEPMDNVASVALNWLLPLGTATDPPGGDGLSCLLSELIFRGAGGMTSREHSDALDLLGVDRSSAASTHHLRISASGLGDRLAETIVLITKMVREPALPAEALPAVRSLCLQALDSLVDDPQHLVMLRLHEQHMPTPFNRSGYGERAVLEGASIETLRGSWAARCHPRGAIIACAGRVDPEALERQLNEILAQWSGRHDEPEMTAPPLGGHQHVDEDTAQVHIGLGAAAPREADEQSMIERMAMGVLSGGTSARLFTEVRQKRSLCYSVGASYRAGRDRGMIALYAGTTPERAQETLDVCIAEFGRLAEGVEAEELDRAKIGLKSQLIMQGESTTARAGAIAQDQHRLGRPRTLEEVSAAVDAVTLDDLNTYLAGRVYGPFTLVTIGSTAPEVREEVGV